MNTAKINRKPAAGIIVSAAAMAAAAISLAACGHIATLTGHGAQRPAAEAFGLGPRVSERHVYTAKLQPVQPLRVRQLQSVPVEITDEKGRPVENATITIDGGMPEHGHGLPTQPRVKQGERSGTYEIVGLRFSMGGWWEVKLAIESAAGSDRVTFNLSL